MSKNDSVNFYIMIFDSVKYSGHSNLALHAIYYINFFKLTVGKTFSNKMCRKFTLYYYLFVGAKFN